MAFTVERIRAEVADLLGEDPADIPLDENLADWGLDSVRLMALAERWRSEGADVAFLQLAERPAVEAWAELLGAS
ncbi:MULTISPECIES: phosphopantetheine-binding protein [Streptomycetaceae]|uniref:phosphopantetheine-binding protein n=1 Tax=Streptomycetaceae TaxID=2062 RepID=UPI000CDCC54D|nr:MULTISPECIES: phosphopantetheine-binding protein [Streptomycetaceae]AUY49092.1 isochorismatase [Streptomyces sp. CB01881]MBP0448376.1 isochorismatase [Kitasatospora sp. RG8]TYC77584.1 isochorismatase [Streptomyces sp. CB01881]